MSKDAKYEFKVHESATQRLCSATALVKLLLLEEPTILLEHRKEFLKLALWKITEAESVAKDRTRYCSATAYKSPESKLTHDHVFQEDVPRVVESFQRRLGLCYYAATCVAAD